MEVHIRYDGVDPNKEQESLINKFIDNLKKSHPLKDDVTLIFQNKRTGTMTTGLRTNTHKLKILVKFIKSYFSSLKSNVAVLLLMAFLRIYLILRKNLNQRLFLVYYHQKNLL